MITKKQIKEILLNQTSSFRLKSAILVCSLGLALVVLVLNKGLYYTNYNFTYELKFSKAEMLEQFVGQQYVSRIDRVNNIVSLQHISEEELNKVTNDLTGDFELSETSRILPQGLTNRIAWGVGITISIILLGVYFFVLRRISFLPRIRTLFFFAVVLVLSFISSLSILLGLTSLVSMIYELTDLSLANFLLVSFWALVVSVLLFCKLVPRLIDEQLRLEKFVTLFTQEVSSLTKIGMMIWLIVVTVVGLSLGVAYFIDGILLIAGIYTINQGLGTFPLLIVRFSRRVHVALAAERRREKKEERVVKAKAVKAFKQPSPQRRKGKKNRKRRR